MNFTKKGIIIMLIIGLMAGLAGCQDGTEGTDGTSNGGATETKGEIHFGYVAGWDEGIAMTHLLQAILEDKLGYEVQTTQADIGPVYQGVAQGSFDVFVDTWLPVTHASYMEEFGEEIDLYDKVYEGARIGLVVPEYVEIDSIEELNDHKDQFEGRIVGIDAGAGIMLSSEEALEAYDLDYELIKSSGPAMTASLASAVEDEKWVVVTGWAPHWKFARWDLKFLEDPKGVYGEEEDIYIIARKGLDQDAADVASLLNNFYMDDVQLGTLEDYINDGMEPVDAGRKWMEENPDVIDSWLQ